MRMKSDFGVELHPWLIANENVGFANFYYGN